MRAPDFWHRDGCLARALSPLSLIWRAAAARRAAAPATTRVPVPVVCVGNVVAGGAGKTPVAISIAEILQKAGRTPHFLSRGYGGSETGPVRVEPGKHDAWQVGDEPLLLAARAPTWVSRDRAAGAVRAADAGADIVVMDDGFQNPQLHKDLSILVVDGGYGFGNGRVIPAGPLREPVAAALDRAAAVVIVGEDTAGVRTAVGTRLPVLAARFVPLPEGSRLSGKRVVAFAGIGRPEKFFETLAGIGCEIVERRAFPDHHPFGADEIMELVERAAAADAVPVTTEKDAVRLPQAARPMVEVLPVALEWDDPTALEGLLLPLLAAHKAEG